MSWAIGYDEHWKRDIGYGVPAYCDHPDCGKEIDRGISSVCGGEPFAYLLESIMRRCLTLLDTEAPLPR